MCEDHHFDTTKGTEKGVTFLVVVTLVFVRKRERKNASRNPCHSLLSRILTLQTHMTKTSFAIKLHC